jgi:hypothetical protein
MADGIEITLDVTVLHEIGGIMVQELSQAAAREFARRKWSIWSRDRRTKITDSFSYKIVGEAGIELSCSFQGVENFVSGTPIKRDESGNVVLKTGGFQAGKLWFHPGIGRSNFLRVGMENGKEKSKEIIAHAAIKKWAEGNSL